MTSGKIKKYHHDVIRASKTTLLWRHMETVMGNPIIVRVPYQVHDAFLVNDKKQIVVNNDAMYDIRTKKYTTLNNFVEKCGDCVVEHDFESVKSYISRGDVTYTCVGWFCSCYTQRNIIIMYPHQQWYYDTMEPSTDHTYDPKIHRYIIPDDEGFAVTTLTYSYDKNKLISDIDRTDVDSCFFHCDTGMYSFSEDMLFVAYVYNNSLYVSRTTKPFHMHMVSTRFKKPINSVSTTHRSVVVSCDDSVYVFNASNIRD